MLVFYVRSSSSINLCACQNPGSTSAGLVYMQLGSLLHPLCWQLQTLSTMLILHASSVTIQPTLGLAWMTHVYCDHHFHKCCRVGRADFTDACCNSIASLLMPAELCKAATECACPFMTFCMLRFPCMLPNAGLCGLQVVAIKAPAAHAGWIWQHSVFVQCHGRADTPFCLSTPLSSALLPISACS